MELIIYTPQAGPRTEYVMGVLFRDLLACTFRLTHEVTHFLAYPGPKLNYSGRRLSPREVFLPAGPLLQERGIRALEPELFRHEGLPAFFRQPQADADLPFDLPALVFFLLVRYEEYLPFKADAHGRFPAPASLAFRGGFLQQPLVQQWSASLARLLKGRFPEWNYQALSYRFQPTYDIDIPWAFRHRGIWRQLWGSARSVLRGEIGDLAARMLTLSGIRPDPFDTFGYLESLHGSRGLSPKFFFLLADPGRHDPNPNPEGKAYRRLVSSLSSRWECGIHPSYHSGSSPDRLATEIRRFREISGEPPRLSRQHYLKLRFPGTYRSLLEAGISADYTMGYADQPGFRAGIAVAYPWYDLEREKSTPLIIYPFQVMDVTLRSYLGLPPEQVTGILLPMIQAVRENGGTFCTLWHNSSFSGFAGWEGWRACYEDIVRHAVR